MLRSLEKRLERFLETDIQYLLSGSFWLTVGKIAGMGIAFILSVAYARYLSKEIYGNYRYILSALGMLGIFALPGMATSLIRSVARGFTGTFRKATLVIFLSSLGITLGGFAFGTWYLVEGNNTLGIGFIIAGLLAPFVETFGAWRGFFDGKKEFREKTSWNISAQLIYGLFLLGAVAIIFFMELSKTLALSMLVLAYSLGTLLPHTYFFTKTLRSIPKTAPQERGAIRYGFHLSLVNVPSTVATYIDGVLLYSFLGAPALAVYSFAIAPVEQLKSLFGTFASVVFPKLSEKNQDQVRERLSLKIMRSLVFTTLAVITYISFAPLLYSIFFPAYHESLRFSQIFALSLVLFPLGLFGTALKAEGNLKKIYIYEIGVPLIQILALVFLIPIFGLWGAVGARLLGRVSQHVLLMLLYRINL